MQTANEELNSETPEGMANLTVAQLKADLNLRKLSNSGNKDCLISRIVNDNKKRIQEGNLNELITLRTQSQSGDKGHKAESTLNNTELLKQIQILQKQVEDLNNRQFPPQIPALTQQADPNIVTVLTALMESQKLLIDRQINSPNVVQITSTNDTANSIPLFHGNTIDNALEWLKEVERISTLAKWTNELKLTNAISRLAASAKNWQLTQGNRYNDWTQWKSALTSRFKRRITMQEFLAYQSDRKLKRNECLVDYIYAKDALLEKAPFTIPQPDRISMIIGDITEEKWQIALATQNSNTVEELIDRATALDAIRNMQHENKSHQTHGLRPSPKFQLNYSNSHREQFHKYNPLTDDVRNITCWRCGIKGHASFTCSLPPPERGSPIAAPRYTPCSSQQFNSQTNTSIPNSDNINSSRNSSPRVATGSNSTNVHRSTNRNTTPKSVSTRMNDSQSINCIKTNINKRALIPALINNNTEVQALCDPCADITVIQKSCVPADSVIHPWTDGEFQVVDHEIKPIGWISLNIKIGNIDHFMPKIGICTQLPFSLILGFDWQHQVQARCTYDPNGSLCIATPSTLHLYECIHTTRPSISCISSNDFSLPPLDDVILQPVMPSSIRSQTQLIPKAKNLSTEQQIQLEAVIGTFADVFYSEDDNIGLCPYVEFKMDLQSDKPIRCRPYRLTEPDRQFMNFQIQKWVKQGICRPSHSPYAAPAFIVEQPFHESTPRRVVVDFSRTINRITEIDPHPIDQMEDVIKRAAGKHYNSKMDVKSAFHTIRIRETDIHKTGFVTPDGHFEFLRMPFGVTNGPSTMTRAIKLAYAHLAQYNVNTYIDDLSTSHNDFTYHLKVLYKILEATRKAGFKLTPQKSQFAVSEISLFGRILSQDGERPDPERTASVERYLTLKSIHEIRSFLGFANQFRKHIRNYAVIAKPLTNILKGLVKRTSNTPILLSDDQQRTFETLKSAITTAPILAYFKQGLPTFVETDASYSGLGACLSQDQDGKRCVIEYASRTLKEAETRYHSNELECTAVHWALTEKFRLYLLGHKFQLITDNYTTAYVVSKSAVNRKFARYLVDLAQFEFTTVHRPGKENAIADHLSRYPTPAVCLTVTASNDSQICEKQRRDEFCQYIYRLLNEEKPTKRTMSIISNYNIDNNTLVRVTNNRSKPVVVIPRSMREQTLISCHDDAGHMDVRKTLHKLEQRYWWPKMRQECKKYVQSCHTCQIVNRRTANAYGMLQQLPIPTTPWEIVSADHIICLPQTNAGNTNMLVHIDHATRYVIATPSASLAANSVTDALYHHIILRYGPPSMYLSDRGTAFTARHTQRFLQKYGITQSTTPPFSPQANSVVERANGIIISTLKKIIDKNPQKWDTLLPNALLAINTTRQNSTKKSPFYLLHGYEPRLPRELHIASFIDDTPREDQLDLLILARAEAANNVYEKHLDNKRRFDLHRQPHSFQSGDLVLYNWPKQCDHKLSPMFKGPFQIVRPVGAVCYEIKSMTGQRKLQKVVHVQHLRKYHKRDAPAIEEDESSEDEPEEYVQDQADHYPNVPDIDHSGSNRYNMRRNRHPPKRFEQ